MIPDPVPCCSHCGTRTDDLYRSEWGDLLCEPCLDRQEAYDALVGASGPTVEIHVEVEECTGIAAGWCPIHGDCTCPTERVFEYGEWVDRVLDKDHPHCPLHGLTSSHAEALAQEVT